MAPAALPSCSPFLVRLALLRILRTHIFQTLEEDLLLISNVQTTLLNSLIFAVFHHLTGIFPPVAQSGSLSRTPRLLDRSFPSP